MSRSPATASVLDPRTRAFLERSRRAHLATASSRAEPHVVPVCFAVLDERTLAFAVDDKPKPAGVRLRRLRNLDTNPRFALLVDRWDEDWRHLGWVLVRGCGTPARDPEFCRSAVAALRGRYPQYAAMGLAAERHEIVRLDIESVRSWGELSPPSP